MQCLVLMILFSIYQQTIGGLRPVIKAHNDSEVSVGKRFERYIFFLSYQHFEGKV